MKVTRSTVSQKVEFDRYALDGKLTKVISALQKTLTKIPPEYRDVAEMSVDTYDEYGSSYISVEITYRRPETDEELEARRASAEARDNVIREWERVEFERLKAKFGG